MRDSPGRSVVAVIAKPFIVVAFWLAGNGTLVGSEVWLKVVAPQFTLYTPAKSIDALRAAGEFQQFIGALGEIVAADTRKRRLAEMDRRNLGRN